LCLRSTIEQPRHSGWCRVPPAVALVVTIEQSLRNGGVVGRKSFVLALNNRAIATQRLVSCDASGCPCCVQSVARDHTSDMMQPLLLQCLSGVHQCLVCSSACLVCSSACLVCSSACLVCTGAWCAPVPVWCAPVPVGPPLAPS
jgi:hypothetical protein